MKAKDLQLLFYRTQQTRYEEIIPNAYAKDWAECDILAIRQSGFVDEIEIKVSRSDFKADFEKTVWLPSAHPMCCAANRNKPNKHQVIESALSPINYFWFLVPDGLVAVDEVPSYAGLMYAKECRGQMFISVAKQPKRLHTNKCGIEFRYHAARKLQFRYWDMLLKESQV